MNDIRVLYVEDIIDEQETFMRLLRVAGVALQMHIHVDACATLEQVGPGPLYDCILLDLSLANGGRDSSLNWLTVNHGHMPTIIVLSGWAESDEDCIRRGAEDFCHKAHAIQAPEAFIIRMKLDILRHSLRRVS